MSLSSTSNSLKSSGTFNSNSSINSTPSVDRYAALKDLDEQLREIKEKDNNTLAATPANPFNGNTSSPIKSAQPNPFQSNSSPLWFNDNGPAQPTYPMTNGNGMYDQMAFGNGNCHAFNGNGFYPKVTDTNMFNASLSNGFPQKNPFAVRLHSSIRFLNKSLMKCLLLVSGSSIKRHDEPVSMNLANRNSQNCDAAVFAIILTKMLYFNRIFNICFECQAARTTEKNTRMFFRPP